MEKLIQQFRARLKSVDMAFQRYLLKEINWNNRLIAITGARGVGKTTLLLQQIMLQHSENLDKVLYISLDNLYFSKNALSDLVDEFVKRNGKYLFLDEVHKYANWSVEIKNLYDNYPELFIVFTGSSALEIFKGKGDLSRRIITYKLNGLSFREFLDFKYKISIPVFALSEILSHSEQICNQVNAQIRPIKYFEEYIKSGYYPYFIEDEFNYFDRIEQTVHQIIEGDLYSIEQINFTAVHNLKKLLVVLSEIVPYKPNIVKLSQQIEINRETLLKYLYWLTKAELLLMLQSDTYGIAKMNKPEKIYLNNSNLMFALCNQNPNSGSIRETFFYNQLKVRHQISYSDKGDFMVDDTFIFEIGGKSNTKKQIAGLENSFIAADNIEYSYQNTIPIWVFGFLY